MPAVIVEALVVWRMMEMEEGSQMGTSVREKARKIVIAYVIVGILLFLLYHFIFRIAYPDNPLVIAMFYFSLPAILASPYALCIVLEDELPRLLGRSRTSDDEV